MCDFTLPGYSMSMMSFFFLEAYFEHVPGGCFDGSVS